MSPLGEHFETLEENCRSKVSYGTKTVFLSTNSEKKKQRTENCVLSLERVGTIVVIGVVKGAPISVSSAALGAVAAAHRGSDVAILPPAAEPM